MPEDMENKNKPFSLEDLVKAKSTPKGILGIGETKTVTYLFKNPMVINYLTQINNSELLTSKQIKSLGNVFSVSNIIDKNAQTYERDMQMIGHFGLAKVIKNGKKKVASFTLNKTALDAVDTGILERFNQTAQNVALDIENNTLSEEQALRQRIPLPNVPVNKK